MIKSLLVYYIFIFTLLVINIYEVYQIRKYKTAIKNISEEANIYENNIKQLNDNLIMQLKCENTQLMKDQIIFDETGNEIRMIDIAGGNNPVLIIRFSKLNCQTCVISLLNLLKETFSEKEIGKIVFISDYDDARHIYQFKRMNRILNTIYKFNNSITQIDELNIPYLFCLTKEGVIHRVFIPQEFNESTTKFYLREVFSP